jgi:hypothetical protein
MQGLVSDCDAVDMGTDAWRNWNAFNQQNPETENADDELYSDRHFVGGPAHSVRRICVEKLAIISIGAGQGQAVPSHGKEKHDGGRDSSDRTGTDDLRACTQMPASQLKRA